MLPWKRVTSLLITHEVAEAVTLADRVPLPRPRGSTQFAAIEERMLERVVGAAHGVA